MTPQEIEQAAREQYNAEGDTFFAQSAIMNLIYKAQQKLVHKSPRLIEATYTTTSVDGQREYSYPTNTRSIWRVEYDSSPLMLITKREEDSIVGLNSVTTTTGTPRYFSIWANTIILTPAPDTDGLEIKIYSYNNAQVVTTTSTAIDVPECLHMGCVDYVLSEMFAKDGNAAMAKYYRDHWADTLLDAVKYVANRKRGGMPAHVQTEETLNTTILGAI